MFDRIAKALAKLPEPSLTLVRDDNDDYSVMLTFGREAPDSPMAALGSGANLYEALDQALSEARI